MNSSAPFPDRPVAQLLGSTGPIHAVSYSASPGTYILTGSGDRSIRLYKPTPEDSSLAYTGSNSITATASTPTIPHGRLIQTYSAHGYEVLSLAVAADNAHFASAGGDRSVMLWDVAAGVTTRRFGGHGGRVHAVALGGSNDSLVVSGGLDAAVRVFDVRQQGSARPVQTISDAHDAVSALAVRDAEIVAGSIDGRVRTYDVRVGRVTTDVLPASVTSLCLSPDARTVLVTTLDGKVRLMDRDKGVCLRTYADEARKNEHLRVQAVLGCKDTFVVAGDELEGETTDRNEGRIWAWNLLTGKLAAKVSVPWGPEGSGKKVVGRDGKERERKNVVSCLAWKAGGLGDQFAVGGTSGAVTVFGAR